MAAEVSASRRVTPFTGRGRTELDVEVGVHGPQQRSGQVEQAGLDTARDVVEAVDVTSLAMARTLARAMSSV